MKLWERKEWSGRLRALHARGLTDKAIASHLGACLDTVWKARRVLGMPSTQGRGPNLQALRAEAQPGCCLGCDEPLSQAKTGRRRLVCPEVECQRLYFNAAKKDYRMRRAA